VTRWAALDIYRCETVLWSGPASQRSISLRLMRRTTTRSGRCSSSAATLVAGLSWVVQAQRTMCSGSVRIVHSGGSRLPFYSTWRLSRRRTVRRITCRMTSARGKSNQTSRSARCARIARTWEYCHSVTQHEPALNLWTSTRSCRGGGPARAMEQRVYLDMRDVEQRRDARGSSCLRRTCRPPGPALDAQARTPRHRAGASSDINLGPSAFSCGPLSTACTGTPARTAA
jgi:hypothetical protein